MYKTHFVERALKPARVSTMRQRPDAERGDKDFLLATGYFMPATHRLAPNMAKCRIAGQNSGMRLHYNVRRKKNWGEDSKKKKSLSPGSGYNPSTTLLCPATHPHSSSTILPCPLHTPSTILPHPSIPLPSSCSVHSTAPQTPSRMQVIPALIAYPVEACSPHPVVEKG